MAGLSRRRLIQTAAAGVAVSAVTLDGPAAHASLPSQPATRAFAMLDGIGARTSMREANTSAYGDTDLVQQCLSDLRIKHIRETQTLASVNATMHENQRSRFVTLNNALGVRVMGPMGPADDSQGTVQQFATQTKNVYGGYAGGIIEGAENGNEWNGANGPGNTPYVTDPATGVVYKQWAWQLRQRAKNLDLYFRQDPALAGIVTVAPALVGHATSQAYTDLGDISQWVDRGNYHYYPSTDQMVTVPVPNYHTSTEQCYKSPSVHPLWCTEEGLHNAVNCPSTGLQYHPAPVVANYLPRMLLEHFWYGEERTYMFELLDDHDNPAYDDPEDHWGVVRFDGSHKPVYATFKTMVDTMYDAGASAETFTPQPLNMTLTGPSDMRSMLFAKSNGHYVLVVWRNVSIWDRATNTYPKIAASNATLTLQAPTALTVRNGLGNAAVNSNAASKTIPLTGELVMVNIGGS